MRYRFFLILIINIAVSIPSAYAQYENVWAFGNGAGLNFNNGVPLAIQTDMNGFGEGNATVCDSTGQLLFYTNGYQVWDRNGNLMPNGDGIIHDPALPLLPTPTANDYTSSTSQGVLIVPLPDHPHKYYIFSLTSYEFGLNGNMGRLYSSMVNMELNSGMGDLEPMQKGVLIDSGLTEHMTGIVGDRCNVWLLVISRTQNNLKAYNIDHTGIDLNPVLSPLLPVNYNAWPGFIGTSPDRKRIAIGRSGIGLYDFDAYTGIATGSVTLMEQPPGNRIAYSVCFSPDNSKLYTSFIAILASNTYAYQFDLSSSDSLTMISSAFELTPGTSSYKPGPDGKIYTPSGQFMNIINQPDLPGNACQYVSNALPLISGTFCGGGLPNMVPVFKRDTVYSGQNTKAPCFADNFTLHAVNSNGWDYTWNTSTDGPATTVDTSGIYWVSYHTPPCVYHVDTFHVIFNSHLPQMQSAAGCKNDSNAVARVIPAPGDTITYTYTWSRGTHILRGPLPSKEGDSLQNIFAGDYSLHMIAPDGCDTILTITIPPPDYRISFTATDTLICTGDTVFFQNTSQDNFITYQWDFDDHQSTQQENPRHIYEQSGNYHVALIGKTAYNCYDTAYQTMVADSILTGNFFTRPDSICTGQSINFYPQTDHSALGLSWAFGDGTEMRSPNENIIRHAYDSTGLLAATLTTQFRACPNTSFTGKIYVSPLPAVYLGTDTSICLNGSPVLLSNLRLRQAGIYYNLWNTGDTTEILKVVHPGTYTLTIKDATLGCSTTESVVVTKDCYIDIPNAFTPNGDHENDYFFPRQLLSKKLTRFNMKIFNRWGQLVFETAQTDGRGWDGKFNDKPQPQGVYIYLIDAEINGSHPEQYRGNVTLIR